MVECSPRPRAALEIPAGAIRLGGFEVPRMPKGRPFEIVGMDSLHPPLPRFLLGWATVPFVPAVIAVASHGAQ